MTQTRTIAQQLLAEYQELRASLSIKFKEAFLAGSKEIFEKFPKLESFSWPQYASYWNDGDPCPFYVRCYEENIYINGTRVYEEDVYEDDEQEVVADWVEAATHAVYNFVNSFDSDDMMLFTDDGLVTVNRNGTITDESYDHD